MAKKRAAKKATKKKTRRTDKPTAKKTLKKKTASKKKQIESNAHTHKQRGNMLPSLLKRRIVAIGFCLFILLIVLGEPRLSSIPLVVSKINLDSKAIAVCGHRLEPEGYLSEQGKNRLNHAVKICQQRRIVRIFLLGGNANGNGVEANAMKTYLTERGIAVERISVDESSKDTAENIAQLKKLMTEHEIDNVNVITNSYHTRRTARLLSDAELDFGIIFPSDDVILFPSTFAQRVDGLRWIIREYAAICFFDLFHFRTSVTICVLATLVFSWSTLKFYDWLVLDLGWCIRHGSEYVSELDHYSKIPFSALRKLNQTYNRNHMRISVWISRLRGIGPILCQLYRFPSVQIILILLALTVVFRDQHVTLKLLCICFLLGSVFSQVLVRVGNRFKLGFYADHLDDSIVLNPDIDRERSGWIHNNSNVRVAILVFVDFISVLGVFAIVFVVLDSIVIREPLPKFPNAIFNGLFRFIRILVIEHSSLLHVTVAFVEFTILMALFFSILFTFPRAYVRGANSTPQPLNSTNQRIHMKLFISYSHDSTDHKEWVANLAEYLRNDGFAVSLDQSDLIAGDNLPEYMEQAVRDSEVVLLICTPKFADKANSRQGGVGWETYLSTGAAYVDGQRNKFVCLIREGSDSEALPTWLKGTLYVDFRSGKFQESYEALLVDLAILSKRT